MLSVAEAGRDMCSNLKDPELGLIHLMTVTDPIKRKRATV
jgi:hypothetical protein